MSFEFYGLSQPELIIISCFAATFIIVAYIIHLAKSKSKEEEQYQAENSLATVELVRLIKEMWHHQVGNPTSHTVPDPPLEERIPPSTVEVDEEDYVPTEDDKKTLAKVAKHLNKKKTGQKRR